jgi:hypothetical protein
MVTSKQTRVEPRSDFPDASVDHTEASYMPTDANVVENGRRPIAVHRKNHLWAFHREVNSTPSNCLSGSVKAVGFTSLCNARLNRRQSGSSEPIMSLIRPAQWAGDGARRQIESAGSQPVMSRGPPSTTALLRTPMERPDFVVAGRLPASGDTEASSWPRAVGGQSASPDFNGPTPAGRPAARPGGVGGRGRAPAPRRGASSRACWRRVGRVPRRAPGRRSGRGSG